MHSAKLRIIFKSATVIVYMYMKGGKNDIIDNNFVNRIEGKIQSFKLDISDSKQKRVLLELYRAK